MTGEQRGTAYDSKASVYGNETLTGVDRLELAHRIADSAIEDMRRIRKDKINDVW